MGISINGPSGIDTASLIKQLTDIEMNKVRRIQGQSSKVSKQLGAYSQLDTYVNDVASASNKIDSREDFNMFNSKSSNEGAVNITTSIGAQPGSYGVKVFQLAEREKMISKDGAITDNQAALVNDLGLTAGAFEINGVEITLEDTDTLEELRVKINNAKQEDGSELGVTASVLKTADNNYRFVLTSTKTGSEGATYNDVTGGALQSLGILNSSGEKGVTKETYTSNGTAGDDLGKKFDDVANDGKITINGTDINGETVTSVFVKTADTTIDDFAKFVENSFSGGITASVDTDGKMTLVDKNGGNSLLKINDFDFNGTAQSFTQTVTGNTGANVLSMGKDAYFSVDNINMSSSTNKASGFVTGVNFELNAVEYDKTVDLSIDRDISGLATKVEELVNSFNAVKRYVDTATRAGNSDENQAAGILKGDLTARNITSKLRGVFQEKFDLSGSSTYSSLAQIGVKTNTDNGNYELDREAFEEALEDNFDEIVSMFVTEGYTDNSNVIFGTTNDDTEEGIYDIKDLGGGAYSLTVRGGDGTVYNASREGEIISFDDGPASGLYLTAPTDSGDATVTFSKGLAGRLNDVVDSLVESETGTLAIRKKSMNSRIDSYSDQETAMQRRVDAYRNRLVKQFSAMEQIMNTLNSQSASMMSQLGQTGQ